MNNDIKHKILIALEQEALGPTMPQLQHYHDLVDETARRMSLVSKRDQDLLWDHIADSLSVLGGVRDSDAGLWLDIGSGAGFPAIPLAITLPEQRFSLLERRSRRCGFLHMAINSLELENVDLIEGGFPADAPSNVRIITARAVEKPMGIAEGIAGEVEKGAVFLSQNGDLANSMSTTFHVEQIVDNWGELGLRRGELYRVSSDTSSDVPRGTSD